MRLRNLFMILLLCMTVGIFSACTGDDGAQGPAGPVGPQGPPGEPAVTEPEMENPDDCTIFADRSRTLTGSNQDDIMCGNERNNTIRGEDGDDTIFGREGNDNLHGNDDHDLLYGGPGNDELTGGPGSDELYGEAGNDKLHASGDDDLLDGGDGTADMVVYLEANAGANMFFSVNLAEGYTEKKSTTTDNTAVPTATERGTEGEILEDLIDIENIWGSRNSDVLIGDGNDNVIGGDAGADYLDGGGGIDTVSYMGSVDTADPPQPAGVTVVLNSEAAQAAGGHAAGDILRNFENVVGSAAVDTITGDDKSNEISGGGGNDVLDGGDGDDTLTGGDGDDNLDGGAGNDVIVGGDGDDTLDGGDADATSAVTGDASGNDIFRIAKGDGNDTIVANGWNRGDKLHLIGFSADDKEAARFASPTLTIGSQTVTITGVTNFRIDLDVVYRDE